LAKVHRRAASGFVNAVLRKANRDPVKWPDRATELSCPEWLLRRWTAHFGSAEAEQIAKAALQEPEEYVRFPGQPPAGLELESTDVPGAYRLRSKANAPVRLFDIASQSIVPLLQLQPGERYLDLCSAPGNKTRQALEVPLRIAVACDISFSRLRTVGVGARVLLDGTAPLPFPPATFEAVFIDAPCSGTGTIGRNPEIKWRVQPQDFEKFGGRQRALVGQALSVLKPQGRLLYATCSLEQEENEAVVEAILRAHADLYLERSLWRLPGRDPGDGFYAALIRRAG
jgi:16S rRNA (cytosine967-C5)-methyltransferase